MSAYILHSVKLKVSILYTYIFTKSTFNMEQMKRDESGLFNICTINYWMLTSPLSSYKQRVVVGVNVLNP